MVNETQMIMNGTSIKLTATYGREPFLFAKAQETWYLEDVGRKSGNKGMNEFLSGASMTVAFGVLYFLNGSPLWLILGVFTGLVPMFEGLSRVTRDSDDDREEHTAASRVGQAYQEKEILRVAKSENGVLTPTVAALKTSLSIEQAERILQRFAEKGYAELNITEQGRLEYVFPEFVPRITHEPEPDADDE